MERTIIDCFIERYRWASNFHLQQIPFRERWFPSTENAFQWSKGDGTEDLNSLVMRRFHESVTVNLPALGTDAFYPMYSPSEAKRHGKTLKLRSDWDEGQDRAVMLELVRIKYSIYPEKRWLADTGDAIVVEGNWWHDNKWGRCMFASKEDALLHLAGKPFKPCALCENKEWLNWLGKITMHVRQENAENQLYAFAG